MADTPGGMGSFEGPLKSALLRARAALVTERLIAAFWAPFAVLVAAAGLALTGLTGYFGPFVHSALLLAAICLFLLSAIRAARQFSLPGKGEAIARLEHESGLANRPLEALSDALASGKGDRETRGLWQLHLQRMSASLGKLKAGFPRPMLSRRDPYALRFAALFLLIPALIAARGEEGSRLLRAIEPDWQFGPPPPPVSVDAWATPPAYTGKPPIFLTRPDTGETPKVTENGADRTGGERFAVPAGSFVTVQIGKVADRDINLIFGKERVPLERHGNDSFKAGFSLPDRTITEPLKLTADGETVREWQLTALEDAPPVANLPLPPTETERRSLEIFYSVSDDYGVDQAFAVFRRGNGSSSGDRNTLTVPLTLPHGDPHFIRSSSFSDLTSHPWAGLDVTMAIKAVDAKGQFGYSGTLKLKLPERAFSDPVAKEIVRQRRQLAADPAAAREAVRVALTRIAWDPEAYKHDTVVFLALTTVVQRLSQVPGGEALDDMMTLLWNTALRIEDGGLSITADRLRSAEKSLLDAMARGAPQDEIDALIDQLKQTMQQYLEAIARNNPGNGEGDQARLQEDKVDNLVDAKDVMDMVERIRELMKNGMTDAAQQMLAELQRLMENLKTGVRPRLTAKGLESMNMLKSMNQLLRDQKSLMDQTFSGSGQQSQQNFTRGEMNRSTNSQAAPEGNDISQLPDAALQEALRKRLGDLVKQYGNLMGTTPPPFGQASRSMESAQHALERGAGKDAVGAQGDAVERMRAGIEAARKEIFERFSNQLGQGQSAPGANGGDGTRDPFGRKGTSGFQGLSQDDVTIPDEQQIDRARQIRNELQRRANERSRPEEERDYINRLLNRF